MERKIVFFDIDGTLLDDDKQLPPSTYEAIHELKKQGVYVAIATGRAPFMFEWIREKLDIQSFVSFNGQYVVFEGEVIYNQPLDREQLRALKQMARDNDHPLIFMDADTMRASVADHPYIHESMGSLKSAHPPHDETYDERNDIYQALLFCKPEEEQPYIQSFPTFHFVRWHAVSTDVLPYGGSKAEGIKKMIEQLGIARENVYAFGDGLNDTEMLRFVGTGVAMGNGHEEAKKVADFITKPVDEDGILFGLRHLGLLK